MTTTNLYVNNLLFVAFLQKQNCSLAVVLLFESGGSTICWGELNFARHNRGVIYWCRQHVFIVGFSNLDIDVHVHLHSHYHLEKAEEKEGVIEDLR